MPSTSKPSASGAHATPHQTVQEIDALFQTAGLVRGIRGKAAGVTRRVRMSRVAPEELSVPMPVPSIASNGVQLLKITAWESGRQKIPWLWHGFSTRKGGLSRAYCADDAPGKLNLGFTASDDREIVTRNRQML